MKPLLKWPGGKRFLAQRLLGIVSGLGFERYLEPFAGGAALFFELEHPRSFLSDTNIDLVTFYEAVRDDLDSLISKLRQFDVSEAAYYRIRESRPRTAVTRAARFYYLLRFSFNGIYRENLKGEFNVPFGYKTHLEPLDEEALHRGSIILQGTTLRCRTFVKSAAMARPGDLVYFDPPYTAQHNNNGFIKYNARLFQWADQIRLSEIACALVDRGCFVIVSNANYADLSTLYKRFNKLTVNRFSRISAQTHGRMNTSESLFLSPNIPVRPPILQCT